MNISSNFYLSIYSLSSIRGLSEELQNMYPCLKPYTEALQKSLEHILKNNQIQNSSSSEEFFSEAAMILLYSLNFTSDDIYDMMSGNFSNEAWLDMVTSTLKMMVDMKIFGDDRSYAIPSIGRTSGIQQHNNDYAEGH